MRESAEVVMPMKALVRIAPRALGVWPARPSLRALMHAPALLLLAAAPIVLAGCFEPFSCGGSGPCGDGVATGGELCDGNDVRTTTCADLGLGVGSPSCAPDCAALDPAPCFRPPTPGTRDFNGDGYDDIVVGAPGDGSPFTPPGRVYVFLGGAGSVFDTGVDGSFSSAAAGERLGQDVELVGDFDGDAFADLAVAAAWEDPNTPDEWRVYVWLGDVQPPFEQAPDLVLTGPIEEANPAWPSIRIERGGDLNGDGFDDILVGQGASQVGPTSPLGSITVFFGGAAPDATPDGVLWGSMPGTGFGVAFAAGDLDGDSFDDVLAGAPNQSLFGSPGSVLVYRGGPGPELDANPDFTLLAPSAEDYFGLAVAVPGDLNGDGVADAVATTLASAHVFFGGAGLGSEPVASVVATGLVSPAGDVNGDGYADLIVASGSSFAGSYDLYLGGPGDAFETFRDGLLFGGLTGYGPFSPAGDVNGDGLADVVVAADPVDELGRAIVFFGNAEAGIDAGGSGTMTGTVVFDYFGNAVARRTTTSTAQSFSL